MAINLEKYNELKKKSEKAKEDAAKAAGALDQLMKKISEDFGCESIEAAESLLKKLQQERDNAEEEFERELRKFEEKWGELLKS